MCAFWVAGVYPAKDAPRPGTSSKLLAGFELSKSGYVDWLLADRDSHFEVTRPGIKPTDVITLLPLS